MGVLERVKNAKGRTYVSCDKPKALICVEDYIDYKKFEMNIGLDISVIAQASEECYYRFDYKTYKAHKVRFDFKEKIILVYHDEFDKMPLLLPFSDYGKKWSVYVEDLL